MLLLSGIKCGLNIDVSEYTVTQAYVSMTSTRGFLGDSRRFVSWY